MSDPSCGSGAGGLLVDRKLWIPQMGWGGAMAFAAAFRSVGIDAEVCPDGSSRTLERAGVVTSGEECLPARVTLGSCLEVMERPDFAAARAAFFMPTADGPCRFGQYSHYLEKVLRDLGLQDAVVFAPSSRDGYRAIGDKVDTLMRSALRGLICSDLLRKMLHMVRPYEVSQGDADAIHATAIGDVARVLERPQMRASPRLSELEAVLIKARDAFRSVPAHYSHKQLLIGVVGEIFCRLTPFANDDVIKKIERLGGECALAHIVEWVWYTNAEHQKRLRRQGRRFSKAMIAAKLSSALQHRDDQRLSLVFADDFRGYEEPSLVTVLEGAGPYLPHGAALGEMTLSVGKAVCHHRQGCDGVVDVSPFGCMNGIVTEAVYPRVSEDCDGIPIRNFFFDGGRSDLERELEVFMELARSYHFRTRQRRVLPSRFHSAHVG